MIQVFNDIITSLFSGSHPLITHHSGKYITDHKKRKLNGSFRIGCALWFDKFISMHGQYLDATGLTPPMPSDVFDSHLPGWHAPASPRLTITIVTLIFAKHDDVIKWEHFPGYWLTLCAGNSPITGEFLAQRPVTWSFGVSFDLRLNKRLSKQSWGWWFETPSRSFWRHCNGYSFVTFHSTHTHLKSIQQTTVASHQRRGVSNYLQLDCLFNSLFRLTAMKHKAPHYWPFVMEITKEHQGRKHFHVITSWASYQICKIAGCACTGNAGNVSPRRRIQIKTAT